MDITKRENKNRMLRYEIKGNVVVTIDLKNNYHIMCIASWKKEEGVYYATFYISRDDVEIYDLIQQCENVKFNSDARNIRVDLAKYVTDKFYSGFFDYYIERYEYQQKCFNIGIKEIEK